MLINCKRITSIFKGKAIAANISHETIPTVLKNEPTANNMMNVKVKIESDALT